MANPGKILTLFLIISLLPTSIQAQDNILRKLEEIAVIDYKVMMPMDDGIKLATDIFRPRTKNPVPVIFVRTPYNFNLWIDGEISTRTIRSAYKAVKRGYAYVIQNERGRHFSQGEWDILGTPTSDGYNAFSWLAQQSWCNGKVATMGCSSTAEWQMAVAALDHPSHATMIPSGFGAGIGRVGRYYEQGNWFRGGAQQMLMTSWLYRHQNDRIRPTFPTDASQEDLIRVSRSFDLVPERPPVDWSDAFRHLPVQDIIKSIGGPLGVYESLIRRKPDDPAWYQGGLYHDDMDFGVPSLWIVSWYDISTSPNLELYNHIINSATDPEVRENQFLIISPSTHCTYLHLSENTIIGERYLGDSRLNFDSITNGWLDYWLKGKNKEFIDSLPRVQYYIMGMNKWQSSESWPPEGMQWETYYLESKGKANTRTGDGLLTRKQPGKKDFPDGFSYDPENPVPSYGGGVCCMGDVLKSGSNDQRTIEMRDDVLVFTSDPLSEGMEVSGFIEATLYVSSDVVDTDFTIKLIDVYPDGRAFNLDETILRARYREGFGREVFMQKGKVYKLVMSPMSTSNYFASGHSIRIEVSSSNFPRFDRNLNTGGNNFDESIGIIANSKIHHSIDFPSHIKIPVIRSQK